MGHSDNSDLITQDYLYDHSNKTYQTSRDYQPSPRALGKVMGQWGV